MSIAEKLKSNAEVHGVAWHGLLVGRLARASTSAQCGACCSGGTSMVWDDANSYYNHPLVYQVSREFWQAMQAGCHAPGALFCDGWALVFSGGYEL